MTFIVRSRDRFSFVHISWFSLLHFIINAINWVPWGEGVNRISISDIPLGFSLHKKTLTFQSIHANQRLRQTTIYYCMTNTPQQPHYSATFCQKIHPPPNFLRILNKNLNYFFFVQNLSFFYFACELFLFCTAFPFYKTFPVPKQLSLCTTFSVQVIFFS